MIDRPTKCSSFCVILCVSIRVSALRQVYAPSAADKAAWLQSFRATVASAASARRQSVKPAAGGGGGFFSSILSSFSGVAEEAGEDEHGAEGSSEVVGGGGEAAHAPVWASDVTSNDCSLCRTEFTWLRRRHHCRRCGLLVCDDCSKVRAVHAVRI